MRKLFTFLLLAGTLATAQAQVVRHPSQYAKAMRPMPMLDAAMNKTAARTSPNTNAPEYSIDAVNSTKIGSASNAYGYLLNSQVQLSSVGSVGTNGGSVAFVFRQNWQNCGQASIETGTLRFNLSTDGGQSWFGNGTGTNCLGQGPLNPGFNYQARYPNATLFSDGAGTAVSNLNLAYCAPAIDGTTWTGAVYGTANDLGNSAGPAVNQEDYVSQGTSGIYRPINVAQRVPGEFWSATVNDVALLEIRKGTYNQTTHSISWSVFQTLNMDPLLNPLYVTAAGAKIIDEGLIVFSEDGKSGYLIMSGDMIGGWDYCSNAIIMEYSLSNGNFGAPYEVSFNDFPCVPDHIVNFYSDTVLADRGTMLNQSATVDSKGHLHIHSYVAPAADSTTPGSFYPGFAADLYDLTKDANGNWGLIHIAEISQAKCQIGSGTNLMNYYTFADITRSPDGKYIMYSWSDTDTTGIGGGALLDAPNLKGRIYDVLNNTISPVVDWTSTDATWAGLARMPKTAEVALEPTAGTFTVPTSIIRFFGTPAITDADAAIKETDFYYFSNIQFTASQATDAPEWCVNCASVQIAATATPTATSSCLPTATDGSIAIDPPAGGTAPYSYVIDNAITGASSTVTTSTVANLAAGLYYVTVVDANGCESPALSVSINQAGAPTATASSVDITCNGSNNGTATVNATGGSCAGAYTYNWSTTPTQQTTQTATALSAGSYTVAVSCSGCTSFAAVSINEPSAISASAVADTDPLTAGNQPLCNGSQDGNIAVDVTGGTPGYTYTWSGNSTATTQDLANVGAGTYSLTVTDSKGCTFSVPAVTLVNPTQVTAVVNVVPNSTYINAQATGGTGTGTYTYSWSVPACGPTVGNTPNVNWNNCPGSYTVYVTDGNGCTASYTNGTVAVDSKMGLNSFELYPNPATTNAVISLVFGNTQNVSISLVGMNGQTIINRELRNVMNVNEELNLSNLSTGVYLVKVTTARGTITRKLIIE